LAARSGGSARHRCCRPVVASLTSSFPFSLLENLRARLETISMSSESDRLLVQQIRQGDQKAWNDLIARYEGRLLAFVDRRLRDRAASEDVVQETFVGFATSLPNFDERRELQTYLFTIASHKLTDYLRRQGRHPLHP